MGILMGFVVTIKRSRGSWGCRWEIRIDSRIYVTIVCQQNSCLMISFPFVPHKNLICLLNAYEEVFCLPLITCKELSGQEQATSVQVQQKVQLRLTTT
jgi:hypothetical protein